MKYSVKVQTIVASLILLNTFILADCNTVSDFGKDIQQGGQEKFKKLTLNKSF